MSDSLSTPRAVEDEFGTALSGSEAVQRAALEAAEAAVRDALEALQPFVVHEGRVLPGIEAAVSDVRGKLSGAASNLAAIVTLHLAGQPAKPAPNPIESAVDREHAANVVALRQRESA